MDTTRNIARVSAQLLRVSARKLEQGGSWKEAVDEVRAVADELEAIEKLGDFRGARDLADDFAIPFEAIVANIRVGFWHGYKDSLGDWWVAGAVVEALTLARQEPPQ